MSGPRRVTGPSPVPRALVAMVVGAAGALTHYLKFLAVPSHPGDFGLAWFGARALIHGSNPYELIGPGLVYDWPWRLIYPATAMVAAMPFTLLPQFPATLIFVFLSCALLAWSVTGKAWFPLLMCSSAPFLIAAGAAQWSPIFTAAMALPALGFLFAAKPTVGFALAISGSRQLQWFALAGFVVMTAVSLMLFPQWPVAWFKSLSTAVQIAPPLLRIGGFAILLVLLRWRRPEARLIVALACVPQTGSWYEVLPLFLVASSAREMMILVGLSSLGWLSQDWIMRDINEVEFNRQVGALIVALAYLPATIIVMRRPNENATPG